MQRLMLAAIVMIVLIAPAFAGDAETPPSSLIGNQGVEDAIAAWEAWMEYQIAIVLDLFDLETLHLGCADATQR